MLLVFASLSKSMHAPTHVRFDGLPSETSIVVAVRLRLFLYSPLCKRYRIIAIHRTVEISPPPEALPHTVETSFWGGVSMAPKRARHIVRGRFSS